MRTPKITTEMGNINLSGDDINVQVSYNYIVHERSEAVFSAIVGLVRAYTSIPAGDTLAGTLQAIEENIEDGSDKRIVSVAVPAKRGGMTAVLNMLTDTEFRRLYGDTVSNATAGRDVDPDFMLALMREMIQRGWQ